MPNKARKRQERAIAAAAGGGRFGAPGGSTPYTGGGFETPAAPPPVIAGAPPPPGARQGNQLGPGTLSLEDMLKKFGAGFTPSAAEGFQGFLTGQQEGGPTGMPSFEDMFKKFIDVGRAETERQAAQLTETFGSRGARYGSDILGGQARLRAEAAGKIAGQGLGAITDVGQVAAGFGQLEAQQREFALQRMFQDFLRQSGVPELAGQAAGFIGGQSPERSYAVL